MPTIYLNIGSNNGDRHALIEQAVAAVSEIYPGARVRRSDYIETVPWGFESEYRFLNIGVAVTVDNGDWGEEQCLQTLHKIAAVERGIDASPHRDSEGNYIDRKIDIDIIAIDDMVMDTPELTLPHPRMHLREFVLKPMAQLAPEWRHPILNLTAEELIK